MVGRVEWVKTKGTLLLLVMRRSFLAPGFGTRKLRLWMNFPLTYSGTLIVPRLIPSATPAGWYNAFWNTAAGGIGRFW